MRVACATSGSAGSADDRRFRRGDLGDAQPHPPCVAQGDRKCHSDEPQFEAAGGGETDGTGDNRAPQRDPLPARGSDQAFNAGDMDMIRELFDERIVWHNGGRSRFSHDAHGIDETLGFFMELVQASDGTFHLDIHDIIANDDHAVALVTSHQEIGGVKYEDLGSHVVHMKDGKVTEFVVLRLEPIPAGRAFPSLNEPTFTTARTNRISAGSRGPIDRRRPASHLLVGEASH